LEESVRILEHDPELGLRVPAAEIAEARAQLRTPVMALKCGHWEVPSHTGDPGALGFLLLEGVLARDMILAGNTATDLLGEGDVLQPWVPARDDGLVPYHVQWHVLAPLRLAVLDGGLARELVRWPQVMAAVLERVVKRVHRMAIHQALLQLSPVETRLLVLFWHLAERWGHVTPDGVALRLRLSHEVLGQLVGCQRPSVTTALRHIDESGRLARRPDGTWLLRGSAPDEMVHVHWHAPAVSSLDGRGVAAGPGDRRARQAL
jgi:CRP-like cAMP-binding protein